MSRARVAVFVAVLALVAVVAFPGAGQHAEAQAPEEPCDAPEGVEGCWEVHFEDLFLGSTLDTDAWEPGWYVDEGWSVSVNSRENACYHTDQVEVRSGSLRIRLDTTTDPECLDKQGDVVELVGGVVSARDARNDPDHPGRLDDAFYLESRVQIPAADGEVLNWPAFWTGGFGPWPQTGEIDIAEGLGGQSKYNYHYGCGGGHCQVGGTPHAAESGDGDWHTYGVLRTMPTLTEPATLTFFFDGEQVATIDENIVSSPHYIIFSYTSHQTETPLGVGETMLVDWVRTWSSTEAIRGDASCSAGVSIVDALVIAQYAAIVRTDTGACPLDDPASEINAAAGDVNDDGRTNVVDALLVAQCVAGINNAAC